jgi:hypothetical protein
MGQLIFDIDEAPSSISVMSCPMYWTAPHL